MSSFSTPNTRTFVGKRNKMTAADVRKHVMTGSLLVHHTNPNHPSALQDSTPSTLCVSDVSDCVDVEDILSQRKLGAIYDISSTNASPRKVTDFPPDDIEIRIVPREVKTVDSLTDMNDLANVEPHVREIISSFQDPFALVQKRYQHLCSGEAYMRMLIERPILLRTTTRPVYEGDGTTIHRNARSASLVVEFKDTVLKRASYASNASTGTVGSLDGDSTEGRLYLSQPDPTLPGVIARVNYTSMDQANDTQRSAGRQSSIVNLLPLQSETDVIERRSAAQYPDERMAQKLLVSVNKMVLVPSFEPVFGTMAIYDAKLKRKVSENFYFDVNSDDVRNLIPIEWNKLEPLGRCNQGAFNISCSINDLFLVIKLEKVLQACEVNEASEPYANRDEAKKDKLIANAVGYCSRLGGYRMPLGFMVVDIWRLARGAGSMGRSEIMTQSSFSAVSTATITGDIVEGNEETDSIHSVDRDSLASSATFRRFGSGTSASAISGKVRTPLQKRKFLGGSTQVLDDSRPADSPAVEVSLSNVRNLSLNLNAFFRQEGDRLSDEDLLKILSDARKPGGKLSKLKTFPVDMNISLNGGTTDGLPRVLNPDMLQLSPFQTDGQLTKELLEFPLAGNYAVNTSYRNILYVYPRSANLSSRQGTARNISIKVQLMNGKEEPLSVVFPSSTGTTLGSVANSTVAYHNKTPELSDEIKMRIPVDLNDGHHLLFSFYHIACKPGNKDDEVAFPIGYSWIPLYRNGRITSGEFALPICSEKPPQSYGYLFPEGALPNIKWIDNHRKLFNITILPVSTVHPLDDHVCRLFTSVASLSSTDRRNPPVTQEQLVHAIQSVLKSSPEPMVGFLYNIIDKLIALIANTPFSGETVPMMCFETLGHLVKLCTRLLDSCLDQHGRSAILVSYIHYFKIAMKESRVKSSLCKENDDRGTTGSPESQKLFGIIEDMERTAAAQVPIETALNTSNKAVHEELADLWLRSGGVARVMAFRNAWFFLELMSKSMAEYLSMTGRLYLPRRSRFGTRFTRSLSALSTAIISELFNMRNSDPVQSSSLVCSWAFFLRDILSLMDRTYVLNLIRDICSALGVRINDAAEPESSSLMLLRLNVLRIVCSHEHFPALNLPLGRSQGMTKSGSSSSLAAPLVPLLPASPGSSSLTSRLSNSSGESSYSTELCAEFRRSHFLIGIALTDLSAVLETSTSSILHAKAIGLIRNLLATHEADGRLSDASMRARVAILYMPLVGVVLDAVPQLHDPRGRSENSQKTVSISDGENTCVNPRVALAIAGIGNAPGATRSTSQDNFQSTNSRRTKLSLELTKQLVVCTCWVLRNVESSALKTWLRDQAPNSVALLIQLLHVAVACFEYKPNSSPCDEESVASAGSEVSTATDVEYAPARVGVKWRNTSDNRSSGVEDESVLESVLGGEIVMCAVDVLEVLVRVVSQPGTDHLLFTLPLSLKLLLHMMSCQQSIQTLESVFASQRAIVVKYPELVFEQETEQCAELCLQLLRHCSSRIPAVRSQAAASLYLLMRESFESCNSLPRLKMQVTMSLSTLVSAGTRLGYWLNEDCLRRSLKTVLTYAESDSNCDAASRNSNAFAEQIKDLVFNLHMILSDTVKMKEFANDFEMTMDLMYRIAKGYQNNPDLRLTWLLNMASRNSERDLYAEAAQCTIHAAALAAEYIAMTSTYSWMPRGAVEFQSLSDNVLEESAVSDDVVSPEADGVCESRHFTPAGLVHLVESAAIYLEKALMYELVPEIYKIVEPIVREWRDYRRLSAMHARVSEALARVDHVAVVEDTADAWLSPLRGSDKRNFGTYFRVGFYGSRFGDLDGEEFIYKEPPFTKLSEISHRLEAFYMNLFGKGLVEIIKDSNNVVRTSQDSSKAYLQITYVEPFLEKWEKKRRTTNLERNFKIRRFMYATPFTRDGKAHGALKDQYKRKTILTAQHSFPYVKTRVRVVDKEQKVLTPIQVAIEDVEKKTRELSAAISQCPPDAKMLQMVLQGCIGTTVNQGPVQVAQVFLADVAVDSRGKPGDPIQNSLRLAFRDFSKRCADALTLNKHLIQPDQYAYQTELEKNYVEFTRRMAPMMRRDGKEAQSSHRSRDGMGANDTNVLNEMGPAIVV